MNSPIKPTTSGRSSGLGAFFSGAKTGAINGGLMLGIYSVVGAIFHLGAMLFPVMGATIITTSIFSGIMSVKRASASKAQTGTVVRDTASRSPAQAMGRAQQQQVEMDAGDAMPRRTDWAARTGRSANTQSRVDAILANGSMSDKNRASAILAERENAASQANSIG